MWIGWEREPMKGCGGGGGAEGEGKKKKGSGRQHGLRWWGAGRARVAVPLPDCPPPRTCRMGHCPRVSTLVELKTRSTSKVRTRTSPPDHPPPRRHAPKDQAHKRRWPSCASAQAKGKGGRALSAHSPFPPPHKCPSATCTEMDTYGKGEPEPPCPCPCWTSSGPINGWWRRLGTHSRCAVAQGGAGGWGPGAGSTNPLPLSLHPLVLESPPQALKPCLCLALPAQHGCRTTRRTRHNQPAPSFS